LRHSMMASTARMTWRSFPRPWADAAALGAERRKRQSNKAFWSHLGAIVTLVTLP
jgi:hypothetical protein